MLKTLSVDISPQKSFPIFIENDEIENINEKIKKYTNAKKILVVISEKVDKLYGKKFNFDNSIKFVLKDGEKEKNFKNYQKIMTLALKNRMERKDAIVAIGGGVVGDLAGFIASTYLRGIDFIQIPTTLLACVDSSVGGKVAINTKFGKNLVGSFYQPKAVFCNINFLKTLDERQFKTGLGEIVKYAFIQENCPCDLGINFFDYLKENKGKIIAKDEDIIAEIIEMSLKLKSSVVKEDEKESGLRKVLNFGHTYAHAVEKITNYKKHTHGEAVSLGIIFALKLASEKGLIAKEYENEGIDLVNDFELVKKNPKFNMKKIATLMKSDKKVEDGNINFVLPTKKSTADFFTVDFNEIIKVNY